MALKVITYCRYVIDHVETRPQEHWDSLWWVKAIKGGALDTLKHHVLIPVLGGRRSLAAENRLDARDWFAEMVAQDFRDEESPVSVVPVPNSEAVRDSAEFATLDCARRIAARCEFDLCDVLRWKREMTPSHQKGGTRDADQLQSALRLIRSPRNRRVLLVDDVMTTGGHLKAARRRIGSKHWCKAVCAARTSYSFDESAWERVASSVQVDAPAEG